MGAGVCSYYKTLKTEHSSSDNFQTKNKSKPTKKYLKHKEPDKEVY